MKRGYVSGIMCIIIGFSLLAWIAPIADSDYSYPTPRRIGAREGYILDDTTTFYTDPTLREIFKKKYGVEYKVIEKKMEEGLQAEDTDFVITTNQFFYDYGWETKASWRENRSANMAYSPMVVLTWQEDIPTLQENDLVTSITGNVYYFNTLKYLSRTNKDISVMSTNPVSISSGFTWATHLLQALAKGEEIESDDVYWHLEEIREEMAEALSSNLTSQQLLEEFLINKRYRMIAIPEHQVIEYINKNINNYESQLSRLGVLYPAPSVRTNLAMTAVDKTVASSFEAMYDYDVSTVLWQKYGFRTSVAVEEKVNPKLSAIGIAPKVDHLQETNGYKVQYILWTELKEGVGK